MPPDGVAGSSDALSGPKPAARTIDVGTRLRPQAEGVRLSKAGREATDSAGKARHYRHSRDVETRAWMTGENLY